MPKKKTDMSRGMLNLLILRTPRHAPLSGTGELEAVFRRGRIDSARRLIK